MIRPFVPGGIRPAKSFYDGIDGRRTTTCSDCGFVADALFGDHAGACEQKPADRPVTALDIIRDHARENEVFSINELRCEFDRVGIKETLRGPAFGMARRKKLIEPAGHVPSTSEATKKHEIKTWRSLHPKFARSNP
jgi:hypothetical protein